MPSKPQNSKPNPSRVSKMLNLHQAQIKKIQQINLGLIWMKPFLANN